jgi:hypothetical protein
VIAVAAPRAGESEIRGFADKHYGDAPVTTFIDRTGGIFDALGGGRYPNSVFLDAQGEVVDPPADWPASTR